MKKKDRENRTVCSKGKNKGKSGCRMRWSAAAAVVMTAVLLLQNFPGLAEKSSAMSREVQADAGTDQPAADVSLRDGVQTEEKNPSGTSGREKEKTGKETTETKTEPESETETESETESKLETESKAEQVSGAGTEGSPGTKPESGPEAEQVPGAGTEGSPGTKPETETEPKTEQVPGAGTEESPGTKPESGPETESGSEPEGNPGMEPESGDNPGSEGNSEPETEGSSELDGSSETKPETEPGTESDSESESESETEMQEETEICTEADSEFQSESESGSETEAESETEMQEETEICAEADSEFQPGPENGSETEAGTEPDKSAGAEFRPEKENAQTETAAPADTDRESVSEKRPKLEHLSDAGTDSNQDTSLKEDSRAPGQKQEKQESQAETPKEKPKKSGDSAKEEKKAVRGQDYEIRGDEGAWHRDAAGRLWVRKGSGLTAEPVGGTYNQGSRKNVLGGDGVFHFNLKRVDKTGNILSESPGVYEKYYVDGEVPPANITIDGNRSGSRIFSQTGSISIVSPPDAQSGLKQTSYQIAVCDENGADSGIPQDSGSWISCGSQGSICLDKEGVYCVYAKTEDHVGNISISKSDILCVDRTIPELTVEGVRDQTANSGAAAVTVRCSDRRYQKGSLQARITGLNNGIVIEPMQKEEGAEGASAVFGDFPREQKYDDIYLLTVQARDIAGNISEKSMKFSVNRCGSVYDLSGDTKEQMQKYYVQTPFDVQISETNVDYVGESKIFCRKDGVLRELVKGQDYQVTLEGADDSWKQYQYQISQDIFEEDGVYELLLTSTDRASNSRDTGMQQKKMTFAVDRTPPSCVISGIEDQGIYEAEQMNVRFHAEDNICLKTMKIYRDGKIWKELSASELEKLDGVVDLAVEEKSGWQTLQVYLEDACGNTYQSKEMPFYLSANAAGEDIPAYKTGKISLEQPVQKSGKTTEKSIAPVFLTVSKTEYGIFVLLSGSLLLLSVLLYCGFSGIKRKR